MGIPSTFWNGCGFLWSFVWQIGTQKSTKGSICFFHPQDVKFLIPLYLRLLLEFAPSGFDVNRESIRRLVSRRGRVPWLLWKSSTDERHQRLKSLAIPQDFQILTVALAPETASLRGYSAAPRTATPHPRRAWSRTTPQWSKTESGPPVSCPKTLPKF